LLVTLITTTTIASEMFRWRVKWPARGIFKYPLLYLATQIRFGVGNDAKLVSLLPFHRTTYTRTLVTLSANLQDGDPCLSGNCGRAPEEVESSLEKRASIPSASGLKFDIDGTTKYFARTNSYWIGFSHQQCPCRSRHGSPAVFWPQSRENLGYEAVILSH
jgi:hypothetical protein